MEGVHDLPRQLSDKEEEEEAMIELLIKNTYISKQLVSISIGGEKGPQGG